MTLPDPKPERGWRRVRDEHGVLVRFYFDDADPVARCEECQWHCHGDSAADAFSALWRHIGQEHWELMG